MGRDCYRDGGYGGDGGGGVISSSKSKRKANAANGCMAAFYNLFDFQHFYFTIDSPSRSKVKFPGLKVIEESPPLKTYKEKQSLNIPVRTEIGTISSRLRVLTTDTSTSSSEICNSPGSKTPNLVARLMGLDLLPDKTDLNHESNGLASHRLSKDTRLGTRSLPVSPRVSSSRKSDFDIHRLSLQLKKENKSEEFGCSRLKLMKQDQEENQSPRDYAKQIVKQIKERVVTRRAMGMDITNSVKNREGGLSQNTNEVRRDTCVSCSPRTRFSDKENKSSPTHKTSLRSDQNTQKLKPKPTAVILVSMKGSGEKQNKKRIKQRELRPISQCKKSESERRFSQRLKKPSSTPDSRNNLQESLMSESREAKANNCSNPLNKKKSKKISKSNDLFNITSTKPSQKQINYSEELKSNEEYESYCSNLMHKIEENSPQEERNYKSDDESTVSASSLSTNLQGIRIDSEKDYITKVMKHAGIKIDSPITSTTILNPSIFHKLEHSGENKSGSLALRSNRRLLFDLVNEILIDTLKGRRNYDGWELIDELCSTVAKNSRKRCQIPVEMASRDVVDLLDTKKLEEEIIAEIGREIIDALVREIASELSLNRRRM